nr:MAG TPA: hypothetical protein [Caudoviricetes sp.]
MDSCRHGAASQICTALYRAQQAKRSKIRNKR